MTSLIKRCSRMLVSGPCAVSAAISATASTAVSATASTAVSAAGATVSATARTAMSAAAHTKARAKARTYPLPIALRQDIAPGASPASDHGLFIVFVGRVYTSVISCH